MLVVITSHTVHLSKVLEARKRGFRLYTVLPDGIPTPSSHLLEPMSVILASREPALFTSCTPITRLSGGKAPIPASKAPVPAGKAPVTSSNVGDGILLIWS